MLRSDHDVAHERGVAEPAYDGWWNHTYATLHMWMQVAGKIALAPGAADQTSVPTGHRVAVTPSNLVSLVSCCRLRTMG